MLTYDDFCKGWNGKLLGKADARDVFDFLSQPENINQMIVMSDLGLPALGGVVKTLESKFANAANFSLSEKEHRKDVGAMVKRILGEFGYETFEKNQNHCAILWEQSCSKRHTFMRRKACLLRIWRFI